MIDTFLQISLIAACWSSWYGLLCPSVERISTFEIPNSLLGLSSLIDMVVLFSSLGTDSKLDESLPHVHIQGTL